MLGWGPIFGFKLFVVKILHKNFGFPEENQLKWYLLELCISITELKLWLVPSFVDYELVDLTVGQNLQKDIKISQSLIHCWINSKFSIKPL